MLASSLAKIRLHYENARDRRRRQAAAVQMATLHAIFAGTAAIESQKGFDLMKAQEKLLRGVIEGDAATVDQKPDQRDALQSIRQNLLSSGARVSHSPLQK